MRKNTYVAEKETCAFLFEGFIYLFASALTLGAAWVLICLLNVILN